MPVLNKSVIIVLCVFQSLDRFLCNWCGETYWPYITQFLIS